MAAYSVLTSFQTLWTSSEAETSTEPAAEAPAEASKEEATAAPAAEEAKA
jgi:hypothetical protein